MELRRLIAIGIVFLMIVPTAMALARPFLNEELDTKIDARDPVLNRYLVQMLKEAGPKDEMGVIVQFEDEVGQDDLMFMRAIGMTVERQYRVIPAVYATGSKESIVRLAGYGRTHWMEYNLKMELYMHETTTVINATKSWNTAPLEVTGRYGEPIDGTGVTVAIVDTGVDAGHPDLDYGEKTIINLKSDLDGTFTEIEDGDTGSGHGTHCAGTVAGNGDASAGARRGVAPGAKLVGISTGEHWLQNVLGALEWVYEHSRPNNNPYNIRVVSNSWGSGAEEYDPNNAITIIANRITYENNVVVVFAAGNSGQDNHDGHTITTSLYGNTPAIVQVAASLHEGDGLAYFSSRGQADKNETWPDIAAPGYHIWATEARKTQITAMVSVLNPDDMVDAYYMSISGTSMATPHVSGAIALLWQAAPSMRVMNLSDDATTTEEAYWTNPETRIHEAEWILEATSTYMEPTGDNGIPEDHNQSMNHHNHKYDFAQGYGLINMDLAVQVALALEMLRIDDPDATVHDAADLVMWNEDWPDGMAHTVNVTKETNTLYTEWIGEWGYLIDANNELVTRHARHVFIPNETGTMSIDLNYNPATSERWAIGQLTVAVDSNQDGNIDWTGQGGYDSHGYKHDEVSASSIGDTGAVWDFYITGTYMQAPGRERPNILNNQFNEILIEYALGIKVVLEGGENGTVFVPPVDIRAAYAQWDWGDPDGDANGSITMERFVYNYSRLEQKAEPPPPPSVEVGIPWWLVGLVAIIAAVAVAYYFMKKSKRKIAIPSIVGKKAVKK